MDPDASACYVQEWKFSSKLPIAHILHTYPVDLQHPAKENVGSVACDLLSGAVGIGELMSVTPTLVPAHTRPVHTFFDFCS